MKHFFEGLICGALLMGVAGLVDRRLIRKEVIRLHSELVEANDDHKANLQFIDHMMTYMSNRSMVYVITNLTNQGIGLIYNP